MTHTFDMYLKKNSDCGSVLFAEGEKDGMGSLLTFQFLSHICALLPGADRCSLQTVDNYTVLADKMQKI